MSFNNYSTNFYDKEPPSKSKNNPVNKEHLCVLYIGRRGSGKTMLLLKKLKLYDLKKTDIILISPTAKLQDTYTKDSHLFKKYYSVLDESIILEIIEEREKNMTKDLILVFDDIGSVPFFKREKTSLQGLINNCRHHKIHVIFLLQKMTQATTTTRENADLVFCFKLWNQNEIKLFRETFFGLMEKSDFDKFSYKAWNPSNGDKYSYITALRVGASFRFGIKDYLFPEFDGKTDSLKPVQPVIIDRPKTTKTLSDTLEYKDPNKAMITEEYTDEDSEEYSEDEFPTKEEIYNQLKQMTKRKFGKELIKDL